MIDFDTLRRFYPTPQVAHDFHQKSSLVEPELRPLNLRRLRLGHEDAQPGQSRGFTDTLPLP